MQKFSRLIWKLTRNASWHTTGTLLDWKARGYLNGITQAIDVGAYVGHYAESLACVFPGMPILAVEPFATTFVSLKERFAGRSQVEVLNCAIGDVNETRGMFVSNISQANSLLKMTEHHTAGWPTSGVVGVEEVQVCTLDRLAESHQWGKEIFLKLDIQGAELQAMAGAEKLLPQLRAVQVEVNLIPLYAGCPTAVELINYFDQRGFQLADCFDFLIAPEKKLPASCDMLFVNRNL